MIRWFALTCIRCWLVFSLVLLDSQASGQRPHIIYIMTDDMGYGDLGSYGRKDYKTPHLDKLAGQGTRFLNAYAAAPLCTPTRVALMTGRYPARTPVGLIEPLTASVKDSAFGLTPDYPCIATLIRDAGYQTALIGKWHLGFLPQHSPTRNGYDYFFGIRTGAADYISHLGDSRKHDLYENDSLVYPAGYLTDLIAEKATAFIKQRHQKPFFLAITFNAPHWPWQAAGDKPYADSTDFRKGGSASTYALMMKSLDDAVGEILKAVDDQQLTRETLVIFTNDNGGERYSEHGGLAQAKGSLWEGGIKVPAFVRWPGRITAGTTTQQSAITMDWTKTMLAVAGAKEDPQFPLDGLNLVPVLTGRQKNVDRTFYWRTFQRQKQKAIREGAWKYLQDEKGEYLFNVALDPGETKDQKTNQESIFLALKKKYSEWEKKVLQPLPL